MVISYCTVDEGTRLAAYDIAVRISNALYKACSLYLSTIKALGSTMYLVLPDGWVFPIIENSEPNFKPLPVKKFWALRFSINLPAAGVFGIEELGINFPFPKQTLQSIWEAFVAPVDYFIPDSEYWPYADPDTGEIKQGVSFAPIKRWGVLSNLPKVMIWGSVILAIVAVFEKLGLVSIGRSFAGSLTTYVRNKRLMNTIETTDDLVNEALDQISEIKTDINTLDTKITTLTHAIGVRLILR